MPSLGVPELMIILFLIVVFGLACVGVFVLMRVLGRPAVSRKVEALES